MGIVNNSRQAIKAHSNKTVSSELLQDCISETAVYSKFKTLKVSNNYSSKTIKGQVCVNYYFENVQNAKRKHLLKQVNVLVKKTDIQK